MFTAVADVSALWGEFDCTGYVRLADLVDQDLLATLRIEVSSLESLCVRRDFTMACMNGAARHMRTLGGQIIDARSVLIPELYRDARLRRILAEVTGLPVSEVPDLVERHVLNVLDQPGDTHGAHIDDYPVALVIFLEAPDAADGGLLEFAPKTTDLDLFEHASAPGTSRER